MAITVEQTAAAATKSVQFGSNTVDGRSIIVIAGSLADEVSSVSDTDSNVYVKMVSNTTSSRFISMWLANDITGGTTPTVTMVHAGSPGDSHIVIAELGGNLELDQADTEDSPAVTFHDGGSITTGHDDTIVIMGARFFGPYSVSEPRSESYANLDNTNRMETQFMIYTSIIDPTDADFTTASNESGGTCMVSLNEIAGAQSHEYIPRIKRVVLSRILTR